MVLAPPPARVLQNGLADLAKLEGFGQKEEDLLADLPVNTSTSFSTTSTPPTAPVSAFRVAQLLNPCNCRYGSKCSCCTIVKRTKLSHPERSDSPSSISNVSTPGLSSSSSSVTTATAGGGSCCSSTSAVGPTTNSGNAVASTSKLEQPGSESCCSGNNAGGVQKEGSCCGGGGNGGQTSASCCARAAEVPVQKKSCCGGGGGSAPVVQPAKSCCGGASKTQTQQPPNTSPSTNSQPLNTQTSENADWSFLLPTPPPSFALPPQQHTPSALFLPSTLGTSACFCGDSCACVGCATHDPYSRKVPPAGLGQGACACGTDECDRVLGISACGGHGNSGIPGGGSGNGLEELLKAVQSQAKDEGAAELTLRGFNWAAPATVVGAEEPVATILHVQTPSIPVAAGESSPATPLPALAQLWKEVEERVAASGTGSGIGPATTWPFTDIPISLPPLPPVPQQPQHLHTPIPISMESNGCSAMYADEIAEHDHGCGDACQCTSDCGCKGGIGGEEEEDGQVMKIDIGVNDRGVKRPRE
ncbi:hypothetical protein T439DRAFT_360198 [Meredithblackwellia eburnea MCA 4105]